MVRLSTTPDTSKLLQNRESLFYFNLREIPSRSEEANVLQIAPQTKIKLLYRPAAIKTRPSEVWQDQLILNEISGGYHIRNPAPYYVTVIGLGGSEKQIEEDELEIVMLLPRSEQTVKSASCSTPYLPYISDCGGHPILPFICNGGRCSVKEEK